MRKGGRGGGGGALPQLMKRTCMLSFTEKVKRWRSLSYI